MGLPRAVRLRRSAEVRSVLDDGRRVAGRLAVLCWRPRSRPGIGVAVVAGRALGTAVRRNRARRRLREAVRQWLPCVREWYDLVWIARAPLAGAPYRELLDGVGRLLRQAGLLGEERRCGAPTPSCSR